jgi:hypothetical protein
MSAATPVAGRGWRSSGCRTSRSGSSICRPSSSARRRAWPRPASRARLHPLDLLDADAALPSDYPLVWMSQFLDCFSPEQIVAILGKVRAALPPAGRLWILELFWDRQRFEAAAFSLQQTSLYFSCVANGNSQMYDSEVFLALVRRAGFEVAALTDGVGGYHTLLDCRVAH